jgi:hypothetical protein
MNHDVTDCRGHHGPDKERGDEVAQPPPLEMRLKAREEQLRESGWLHGRHAPRYNEPPHPRQVDSCDITATIPWHLGLPKLTSIS